MVHDRVPTARFGIGKRAGPPDATFGKEAAILNRGRSQLGRLILKVAVGSLAVELLLSELWLRFARDSSILALLSPQRDLTITLAAGLVLAVVVALASRLFFSTFGRSLTEEFLIPFFGGLGARDVAMLSLLPGLGEEIFFRGVLQPEIGWVPASVVFGLMHSGFSRKLLPYGLWATLVGGLLGALYLWTGSLLGCIVAHALTNALGVTWLKRLSASSQAR